MMDPLDDFEFKPLTDGLGFHKKAESQKPAAAKADTSNLSSTSMLKSSSQSISELIAALPPSLDFLEDKEAGLPPSQFRESPYLSRTELKKETSELVRPHIHQPIGRGDEYQLPKAGSKAAATQAAPLKAKAPLESKTPTAPPVLPTHSPYQEKMSESFAKAFPKTELTKKKRIETPVEELMPAAANFSSAVLDGMVVAGLTALALAVIVIITGIDIMALFMNSRTDAATQLHIVLLAVSILHLYFLTSRSFFGASLGEWAFEMQVGTGDAQKRALYPLQVVWRTLILLATGIVLIPILSLIFGRDLLKPLTGLQLYRRK